MKLAEQKNLGQTKTKAFSMNNQGFSYHALTPIAQARPAMAGIAYRAAPIEGEKVTLYSFANIEDRALFLTQYGGEILNP